MLFFILPCPRQTSTSTLVKENDVTGKTNDNDDDDAGDDDDDDDGRQCLCCLPEEGNLFLFLATHIIRLHVW